MALRFYFEKIRIMFFTVMLLLVFCVIRQKGIAQENSPLVFKESIRVQAQLFSQEEGLSQGMILDLVQDSIGYLWIATMDGLNRFDGRSFKVYRPEFGNPNSISNGYITALCLDSRNRLWVGTKTGGLNLYDYKQDRFIQFTANSKEENNIGSNQIKRISQLPNSDLIIDTKNGNFIEYIKSVDTKNINYLEANKDSLFNPLPNLEPLSEYELSGKLNPRNHFVDSKGSIWIQTKNDWYQISANTIKNGGNIKSYKSTQFKDSLNRRVNKFALTILPVTNYYNNDIYKVVSDQILAKYDSNSDTFKSILVLPDSLILKGKLFVDQNNFLWSTQKSGNFLKVSLTTYESQMVEIMSNKVREVLKKKRFIKAFIDRTGNIWLGSNGYGLIRFNDKSHYFQEIQYSKKTRTPYYRISTINNKAFFDTNLQKIYKKRVNDFPLMKEGLQGSSISTFSHLAYAPNGTFWKRYIDHKYSYVIGLTSVQDSIIKIPLRKVNDVNNLYSWLHFIDQDSNLWFNTQSRSSHGTLNQYNQKTGKLISHPIPTDSKQFGARFLVDYEQDENKLFWFATIEGVYSFSPISKKWNFYNLSKTNVKNSCISILLDPLHPDSFLWVGTNGNGLIKLNKFNGELTNYTLKDGLPSNVINGILSDSRNNLWLSTNSGLCLFNPQSEELRVFNNTDGVPILGFNRFAYSKDKKGNLYFQGEGKLVKVYPEAFYQEEDTSSVIINSFKLFNKTTEYHQHKGKNEESIYTLPQPISLCKKLELPYEAQMITFGFTLSDLSLSEGNSYEYRLIGFNDQWIKAGLEQEAIYTNLSAKDYIFQVRGKNEKDVWSKPTELHLTILPPWWETWWFRSVSLLAFSLILYRMYKYRINQLLHVEKMRNDIAQDLHDEIGSTLSSISLYSAVMQNTSKDLSDKSNGLLNKIIDSTSSVMSSMNDMVWTIKSDNDSFEQVVNRIRAFAVDITEPTAIDLDFLIEGEVAKLNLNMHQRKNIYLIFKEAINNAIKYSGCTKLIISITLIGSSLSVFVKDNGRGFDYLNGTKKLVLGGNGIPGMRFRANQIKATLKIESKLTYGTQISLQLKI